MLPQFTKRPQVGVSSVIRNPDGGLDKHPEEKADHEMLAVAEDMLRAHSMKDPQALAKALRAAFEIADSASEDSESPSEE